MLDLNRVTITPDELTEIANRLDPYLPPNLTRAEPSKSPWSGMSYTFRPYTGREDEPTRPSTHSDPRLTYVPADQDEREHDLRQKAGLLLDDMYDKALSLWRDAAYVADLKDTVRDAPARWQTYETERAALEAADAYLRTPQATAEWMSAISRLVDAQQRTLDAATAFDERAADIAQLHRTHLYADLGHHAALTAAGYPDATAWPIADVDSYSYGDSDWERTLTQQVHLLIARQDDHLTKVRRLSGTDA
ncbi:hypothetical protein [Streptomyces sp. 43Y-GA-1]|uniref:hypothetical protein n=1 Tax=Streptomyces sp. 43Y-GA-1 TaxID=2939435 RepID=UPI0020BFBB1E|nr:hypothetical protein [Streptomyces sp. 43Y-GA-1]MCL6293207.1 hypothetical protein [Streptomyces sp. 43Y-GA-1]